MANINDQGKGTKANFIQILQKASRGKKKEKPSQDLPPIHKKVRLWEPSAIGELTTAPTTGTELIAATNRVKLKREAEFLNFEQGNLKVQQYTTKFTSLTRHASYLVEGEDRRARKFRDGLKPKIQEKISILNIDDYYEMEWGMLSFIRFLKSMVRSSNAVAVLTFPHSPVSPSFSKILQHLADTLLSVTALQGSCNSGHNYVLNATAEAEVVGLESA
ncbi:hypothetical protein RJ640_003899 [Escallonia rubra]|uniref:Elongator complex protein 4 n=1 Tax=Escallonia rubra TaxID=112253 RepID=A0AA88RB40_9ASTE|nr:hypothetical protein RJ640_003899 [Escallonia rubra]